MPPVRSTAEAKPVGEFAAHAAALIEQVQKTRRALVLTQQGESAAVVVDAGEYERLLNELELLRDIHAAEAQLANDEGVPHAEARERVLSRLRS
ncbi:MAG TPA: type II toxin-antitoxin system prevent-host-death family antitoxin [Thermoanaerobaculia bacterium]|jgi:prevent-host-death family protein|nr:type II toxin-antitoxin system prevent-host-death family antitoxin [Thermoanaerobaculia bacterium]